MWASWIPRNVSLYLQRESDVQGLTFRYADLEDVGQQLIEDNIVSVSRQMIDKEASMAKSNENSLPNGHQNGNTNGQANGNMEVDEEL